MLTFFELSLDMAESSRVTILHSNMFEQYLNWVHKDGDPAGRRAYNARGLYADITQHLDCTDTMQNRISPGKLVSAAVGPFLSVSVFIGIYRYRPL